MSTSKYTYEPLPQTSDHFRLLKLGRCGRNGGGPQVSISLVTFELDRAPVYHALSYCWGPQGSYMSIVCGDGLIQITPNLFDALLGLSDFLPSEGDQWLWIDQLCINQEDIQERSSQVSLMNGIYTRALRTVIWLSADESCAEAGFGLAQAIFNVAKQDYPDHVNMETLPWKNFNHDTHRKRALPSTESTDWESLRILLRSPWFKRLWVVQEVVLSQQDPTILCGQHHCSWYVFATAASWLWNNGYFDIDAQQFLPLSTSNAESIRQIRATRKPWDMGGLLYMTTSYFQATNLSDKIYGLAGLAGQQSKNLPPVRYDMHPKHVYRDLTRYMVMEHGNLAALDHSHCYSSRLWDPYRCFGQQFWWGDTPTWTPNLDTFLCPHDFTILDQTGNTSTVGWYPFYKASAGIKASSPEDNNLQAYCDPNVLYLNGLRVDLIDHCFEITTPRGLSLQTQRFWNWPFRVMWRNASRHVLASGRLGYIRSALHHLYSYISGLRRPLVLRFWAEMLRRQTNPDVESCATALAMTSTIGMDPEQKAFRRKEDYANFCAYMVKIYSDWKTHFTSEPASFHSSFEYLEKHAADGIASEYETALSWACVIRRCFLTVDGRVGVGSTGMRTGDVVTVLFGSGVPCVLRRHSNREWLFVGFCYVHGLMEGQSIDMWKEGKLKEQCFEIL